MSRKNWNSCSCKKCNSIVWSCLLLFLDVTEKVGEFVIVGLIRCTGLHLKLRFHNGFEVTGKISNLPKCLKFVSLPCSNLNFVASLQDDTR